MGINDIQKINKLAKELLDQGIVSNRYEAVQMAEEILSRKLFEGKTGQKNEESEISSGKVPEDIEFLKGLVQRNTDILHRELRDFRELIELFKQEINTIKGEINRLRSSINRIEAKLAAQEKRYSSVSESREEVEESRVQTKESKKEGHPKRGRFTSEDVSVEKFFYFGKR